MGFGPAVDHLIDSDDQCGHTCGEQQVRQGFAGGAGGGECLRNGGHGAQDRFGGGVHFVFP